MISYHPPLERSNHRCTFICSKRARWSILNNHPRITMASLTKTKQSPSKLTPTPLSQECLSLTPQTKKFLHRISLHPTLTPYRRRVYRTLLSVPEGRWTTYSALAAHLGSSARAVGNAMRTNPFAPEVPCHRVLAMNGTLGGYKGEWILGGKYQVEKRRLLEEEGVVFDEGGGRREIAFGSLWIWGAGSRCGECCLGFDADSEDS
ncbi:MGMT family protein [Aspergillus novofumigatus IBT 16806]|uniref:Methylated-DNA--protein-cysteine methyltransferase n=1 Tax=Aspergillus novofumigatus (strain IBT 16806) TaxID=1392255 RepID=A0A2I1CKG3_ASPN1|nr:DNA binding methylated-DNA--cysteine S-methyltransferase [Aspergillus novofumigatus IBT 16806]PKX98117.1 DNA binding methylated-DNA--cysteine S-methyltransferase [Aspergillus novofumigatus IBT 16806]